MAGDAGAIRAGRAFVEMATNNAPLLAGLKQAELRVRAFGTSIAKIGGALAAGSAAFLAPIVGLGTAFAQRSVELLRLSTVTGASVEALSGLQFAAAKTGVEADELGASFRHMQQHLAEAAGTSAEAKAKFTDLGLSIEELTALTPDEQFRRLASAVAGIENPMNRTATAIAIFGKTGSELLPLLSRGAEGIRAFEAEARELGLVVSTADAQAGRSLFRQLNSVGVVTRAAAMSFGNALTPALIQTTAWMTTASRGIALATRAGTDWIRTHQPMVVTALRIASGIGVAGTAMGAFGLAVAGTGYYLRSVSTAMRTLATPMLSLIGLATTLGSTLVSTFISATGAAISWGFSIAAFLGPLGTVVAVGAAVGAVIAGIGAALFLTSSRGASTLSWLAGKFSGLASVGRGAIAGISAAFTSLAGTASTAWGGISAAISNGDLKGAFDIAVAALELVWVQTTNRLSEAWDSWTTWLMTPLNAAWLNIRILWERGVGEVEAIWDGIGRYLNAEGSWIVTAGTWAVNTIKDIWNAQVERLKAGWNDLKTVFSAVTDVLKATWKVFSDYWDATMAGMGDKVKKLIDILKLVSPGLAAGIAAVGFVGSQAGALAGHVGDARAAGAPGVENRVANLRTDADNRDLADFMSGVEAQFAREMAEQENADNLERLTERQRMRALDAQWNAADRIDPQHRTELNAGIEAVKTEGTFNAVGGRAFSGGGTQEKQLAEQQKANALLQKVIDAIAGGARFAL